MPDNRTPPYSRLTLKAPGARSLLLLALLAAAMAVVHLSTAAPLLQSDVPGSPQDDLDAVQASPPSSLGASAEERAANTETLFAIMQMNPDSGELVNTTYDTTFEPDPAGYSFARHFTIGGNAYLLLLPSQSGYAVIHALLPGGELGDQVAEYHWESRWSAADFVTIGASTYLFLHDAYTGLVRTYQMRTDGTVDPATRTDATHEDWQDKNIFAPYEHGASWYLLGLDTWTGARTSYTVGGVLVSNGLWTRGWTAVDYVTVDGQSYQLLYKAAGDPTVPPGGSGDDLGRLLLRTITTESGTDVSLYDGAAGAGWSHVRFVRAWGSQGDHQAIFFYNRDSGAYRVRAFDGQSGLGAVTFEGNMGPGWTDIEPYTMGFQTYVIALNEEGSAPFYYDEVEKMAQCIHDELQGEVVGYQFGVIQSGQIIYRRAVGMRQLSPDRLPLSTRTRMNVGSVSKMITSLSLVKLADMGEVDLDNPIGHYLDTAKYPPAQLDEWVKAFTPWHMLTHTSGQSGSGCDGDYVNGLDCSDFYTTPPPCGPDTCTRDYQNSNIAVVRELAEWFSGGSTPDEYVELTRQLWADHLALGDISCTGEPDVFYFGPCNGAANCTVYNGQSWRQSQFTSAGEVNQSASCSSGGWYVSSQHLLQFMAALQYEKVLSPEYNELFLDTSITSPGGGSTAISWEPPWTYDGESYLGKSGDLPQSGVETHAYVTTLPDNSAAVLMVNAADGVGGLVRGAYSFATGASNSCPNY